MASSTNLQLECRPHSRRKNHLLATASTMMGVGLLFYGGKATPGSFSAWVVHLPMFSHKMVSIPIYLQAGHIADRIVEDDSPKTGAKSCNRHVVHVAQLLQKSLGVLCHDMT